MNLRKLEDNMEKFIITAPKTFVRKQAGIPRLKADHVLIQTKAVGICGSDVHLYRGDHPYTTYPMVLGHEASGMITEVGDAVEKLKPGDHVVLEPLIPCGTCYPCFIGRSNCCSNMKTVGVTVNGALAEFFTVPASCVHTFPKELPFTLAVLAEPFSIGFHAVRRGNINENDTVLVIGAGMIGLTILAAAKNHGAKVMVADILDYRLGLAEKVGADVVINCKNTELKSSAHKWTNGFGPTVVIEAVGLPTTIQNAVDIVSDAGRIVIVGVTKDEFCIRGVDVTKKELSIIGSRNNLGRFKQALNFVSTHQEIARHLISDTFSFLDSEKAFAHASDHPENTCKVVITL